MERGVGSLLEGTPERERDKNSAPTMKEGFVKYIGLVAPLGTIWKTVKSFASIISSGFARKDLIANYTI